LFNSCIEECSGRGTVLHSHVLIWKEKNSENKIDINIADLKIYSQNKSGNTKNVLKENENLAENLVTKIISTS
jgi:hypothetical protein